MPREILVTSALPYANGRIHLGHIVEHTQSDIWVRAMRMAGHTVHYVCADDAHGTSIMLRAEKEGITPEALITGVWREHTADLRDFGVAYDHYSSTHTGTNRAITYAIWRALEANGHVESKPVKQLYDPERRMFLPDRFIKGECPVCHSKDQYGDACEVCGSTYNPIDLIDPYSVVSGAKPVEKESLHFFVKLADFEPLLKSWLEERRAAGGLQSEVVNKLKEWFADGLRSWDVSRDAPYFGFEIPGQPGKYFYVWVDAPIGYFAAFKELCEGGTKPDLAPADYERFTRAGSHTEMVHFIGKDILYFHTLFWPAMLHGANLRMPTAVNVHGFLTVDGAKMSKSRGTFVNARTYLEHLDADWLRYYLASMLGPTLADIDLDLKAFEERVNSHLVGKWVNIASRCAGFVHKLFDGKLAGALPAFERVRYDAAAAKLEACATLYEARDYAAAMRAIIEVADEANAYVAEHAPWTMAKDELKRAELHVVLTLALNYFRLLTIWLAPVVPGTAARAFAFLDDVPTRFDAARTPLLGHAIQPFKPLATRIDPKQITAMIEASKESLHAKTPASSSPHPALRARRSAPPLPQAGEGAKPASRNAPASPESRVPSPATISIDDFAKLDLRVGKVLVCESVDGSDKLLRFELDAGELGKRQIFSGIKAAYSEPEKLVGRNVVFIANLAPRKMRFGVSEGMILSAGTGGSDLFLLDADPGAAPGASVK
ncbi:MAG: Methionyl-tRNA synthetase [Rhodanobacteraceae bacterium]|jgi:methionyl-tRNA synthetase|nr:MAG: Methionyl-tRNA synthetase [Rhodanobacteraceae bacterium]